MAAAFARIGDNRQVKTALFLIACGWAGAAPHFLLTQATKLVPAIALAILLGGYGLQKVLVDRRKTFLNTLEVPIDLADAGDWPSVDVLVAARDEEAVITRLVERLSALRYPEGKLSIWIIDDGSQDRTPILLKNLREQFPILHVICRDKDAGGGKSGALNAALTSVNGDWLLILDADAQFQPELLLRVVPYAEKAGWSAVQLRKAVVNAQQNLLTRVQAMEMAMDALIQKGRLAGGGVAELRGNGQLLQRETLQRCGGFNEETVTDDLDLSFRFLTLRAKIGILWNPPIQEEAVETFYALWRQRQRWAEGGLQRFFDYWPVLTSKQLSISQRFDLSCFFLLQYALPVVSISDLITTIFVRTTPSYWPLSIVAFLVSGLAYWRGCRTKSEGPTLPAPTFGSLLIAIIYLVHWFVVIPWVTIKMAIFPKRLVWVKTTHAGRQS
ncbi:glycosyltransferase [Prochlorococcus sp. MIT 1300]|uniref:glycosyltransferase n=1 Tax=Prochlorococcus sp. MIT 1300 TaxID=3096218 RepID=UPI002A7549D8|nr:glycosyltransferase [Prochlorococcus sp. MIT 1300]